MVAAAGEYYVLARLSLLGKIAAQAPRGVPMQISSCPRWKGTDCVRLD